MGISSSIVRALGKLEPSGWWYRIHHPRKTPQQKQSDNKLNVKQRMLIFSTFKLILKNPLRGPHTL